jgi:hypothetical protein
MELVGYVVAIVLPVITLVVIYWYNRWMFA